jgi:xylan 1,4-beta-xylosidase
MKRNRSILLAKITLLAFALGISGISEAQQPTSSVAITIDASKSIGTTSTAWSYFGYDEPNFTYSTNGTKLLKELSALSPVPVSIRAHNLFTSGDGTGSLKWGSTNVYTEDVQGRAVYDWTVVDRIFDAYRDAGVRPLVELGFTPEALTSGPPPYRHNWPKTFDTGWSYPPKNYDKWGELVFQFTRHLQQRYGDAVVNTWLWEVWNEPDIFYWHGTPEEYFRLYDVSVDAVRRALPAAKIGGPETTGPGSEKAKSFLRAFLEHCARGKNFATGKTGTPLDFISFHPKGSPEWVDDHVRMGMSQQLKAIENGFKIVASFPEWRNTPIILGESDPEGCAACSAKDHPQNSYRNGPLYASYTVVADNAAVALAAENHVNLQGIVTWAFQFDGQPHFEGLRELATNGIDKPVLNAFRMLGLLSVTRLEVQSSAAFTPSQIIESGVRSAPDIDAIATRYKREIEILVVNYHDDDIVVPDGEVDLVVQNLPVTARRIQIEQFRVDANHSNSFTAWRALGSPKQPTASQYEQLEAAGQLQLAGLPQWVSSSDHSVKVHVALPRAALSLLRLSW